MLKIQKFDLIWNLVHNCQIITWWDRIDVLIFLKTKEDEGIQSAILDISQYNKLWCVPVQFKKDPSWIWVYNHTFDVNFLWEQWIECWRNDKKSKICCTVQTSKGVYTLYSNTIWNATYNHFSEKDHHLWVYTKSWWWVDAILGKLRSLSWFVHFPNDIIFKNRFPWNTHFIEVDSLEYSEIASRIALWIKNKAEFLVFSYSLQPKRKYSDIHKLLPYIKKIRRFTKIYFYNIPLCIFQKEGRDFIDEYVLYNAIFKVNTWHASFGKCDWCIYKKVCNRISNHYNKLFWLDEFTAQK